MLQWYTALIKYVDYTAEFGRVCECLQLLGKGNEQKGERFAVVAAESQAYLNAHVLVKAFMK